MSLGENTEGYSYRVLSLLKLRPQNRRLESVRAEVVVPPRIYVNAIRSLVLGIRRQNRGGG